MLYFDHSASTPPYDEVIETMAEVMKKHYANPSSLHKQGAEALLLIERAKHAVARFMNTASGKWIFTSGGTEANNLALRGAALQYMGRGKHIVTTAIEHASVLETLRWLEKDGFEVTYLPIQPSGHISVEQVKAAIRPDTILVSIMHINNEIGTVQPIQEIGELLRQYNKIMFHVDAVQSIGKVDIRPEQWGIDLLSGSAHKFRGPRGAGLLYIAEHVQLYPVRTGGGQEGGLVAGTENVPAIVGTAKALRMSMETMAQNSAEKRRLTALLREGIQEIKELHLNGAEPLAPHIVHFSYPGMKPEVIIHKLEEQGIMASTRSACSSKDNKPSRVLLALGVDELRASSGVRISLGDEHTKTNIEFLLHALRKTVTELMHLERS